jgi:acetyl esterase/lipase
MWSADAPAILGPMRELPTARRAAACLVAVALGALATPSQAGALPRAIEWSGPADARGGVLVLRGGSWFLRAWTHEENFASARATAARFARDGALVANVDYRASGRSLTDALWAADRLRRRLPRGAPICAYGESAGGMLALQVALRRPLARVTTVAAVVSPGRLARDGALDVHGHAADAFGGDLARFDALPRAGRLPSLQLAGLADDPVVPFAQSLRLAAARRDARLVAVAPGDAAFVHGPGDAEAVRRLHASQRRFVATRLARRR